MNHRWLYLALGQVIKCLKCGFGVDDSLYALLAEYRIRPRTNWTVPTHVIHAPGPWPTFEIQLPQDDYQLLAWKLGRPIADDAERAGTKAAHQVCLYWHSRPACARMVVKNCPDSLMLLFLIVDCFSTADSCFVRAYSRTGS
jgi:hypothetical protein